MGETFGKAWPRRTRTVREDWHASLESEPEKLFDDLRRDLGDSFQMLSIILNEALALRGEGNLGCAQQDAGVSGELFTRFAQSLLSLLGGLGRHARHFGTMPNAVSLDPLHFRGATARSVARLNQFLGWFFSQRLRFFLKLSDLEDLVLRLVQEYRETSEALLEGASANPGQDWLTLDVLHYDLNTCFCETLVVLKSYLCALPAREVAALRQTIASTPPPPLRGARSGVPLRHGRKGQFRGE